MISSIILPINVNDNHWILCVSNLCTVKCIIWFYNVCTSCKILISPILRSHALTPTVQSAMKCCELIKWHMFYLKLNKSFLYVRILVEEIHTCILKKCTKLCKHQWSAETSQVIIREYLCCNLNEEFFSQITSRQENSSDWCVFICKVINATNKI